MGEIRDALREVWGIWTGTRLLRLTVTNTRHGDVGGLDDGRSDHGVGRGARRGGDARSSVDVCRRAGQAEPPLLLRLRRLPRPREAAGREDRRPLRPRVRRQLSPWPKHDPAAPVAGVDYSTTNVQEHGVDEPDIMKTDGEKIVAHRQRKASRRRPRQGQGGGPGSVPRHRRRRPAAPAQEPRRRRVAHVRRRTPTSGRLEADRAGADANRLHRGRPLSAEPAASGEDAHARRVVSRRPPRRLEPPRRPHLAAPLAFEPPEPGPTGERKALEQNRSKIRSSRARDWLPTFTFRNRPHRRSRRPDSWSAAATSPAPRDSPASASSASSRSIWARGHIPVDTDGVMTDGQMIYASKSSLYVATQRWTEPGDLEPREASAPDDRAPSLRHLRPAAREVPGDGRGDRLRHQPVRHVRARRRAAGGLDRVPAFGGAAPRPIPRAS